MAVKGKARVDRCTKKLLWRLSSGDLEVIGHRDLDSLAARRLVQAGARAVVNADCSFTGTFPGEGAISSFAQRPSADRQRRSRCFRPGAGKR